MNDIMEPTKPKEAGAPNTLPNTLDLKTPEQKIADQQAAEARAARVASQGGNVVNSIDGMTPAKTTQPNNVPVSMRAEAKPTIPASRPNLAPQTNTPEVATTQPNEGQPSVFKLGSTIPEEKQGAVNASEAQQATPGSPVVQASAEKKPGLLKRLFGGGKKKAEQPTSPEQQ